MTSQTNQIQTKITNIKKQDLLYCRANAKATYLTLTNADLLYSKRNIQVFEHELNCGQLMRVHKSYIVNLLHIREFMPKNGQIRLTDGSKIPVSRRKIPLLRQKLKTLHTVNSDFTTVSSVFTTDNSDPEKL